MISILIVLFVLIPLLFAASVIDVRTDDLLTFSQLSRRLPRRRGDRPANVSTIHRWRYPGLHDVQLEAVRVGGCWCTTMEAYARFVAESTRAFEKSKGRPPPLSQPDALANEGINNALEDLGL